MIRLHQIIEDTAYPCVRENFVAASAIQRIIVLEGNGSCIEFTNGLSFRFQESAQEILKLMNDEP